jgi:hypothetical protein
MIHKLARTPAGLALLLAWACVFPERAAAATCAAEAVTARGEAARFMWLAKTKARANWRRKVRATAGLGTEWSVWSNAADTDERCFSGPDGTLCIFTGLPCKP